MSRPIPLIAGAKFYAGADLPFYISKSMVTSWLNARGFSAVKWHDRKEPLPNAIDPTADPTYDDVWDYWAEATYTGSQGGQLTPPADPAWLRIELPQGVAPQPTVDATAGPGGLPAVGTAILNAPNAPPAPRLDPLVARRYRLGVAVAVFGALLTGGSIWWTVRHPKPKMLPEGKAAPSDGNSNGSTLAG